MIKQGGVRRLPARFQTLLPPAGTKFGIALLLDFDGTLVGICDRPEQTVLPASVRSLIGALAAHPRCAVAIVSGRPASSLRSLITTPNVHFAGNHGLFIEGPGYRYAHPRIASARPSLDRVCSRLAAIAESLPGVWVEPKPASCALHYRLAPPQVARRAGALFSQVVREAETRGRLRIIRGKKVLEVLPDFGWDKGKAVLWLLRKFDGRMFPIYIGDDRTDEDAFRVLAGRGLSIRVGRSVRTGARYFIRSHNEVGGILAGILAHIAEQWPA